jgi:hypothetical protein
VFLKGRHFGNFRVGLLWPLWGRTFNLLSSALKVYFAICQLVSYLTMVRSFVA